MDNTTNRGNGNFQTNGTRMPSENENGSSVNDSGGHSLKKQKYESEKDSELNKELKRLDGSVNKARTKLFNDKSQTSTSKDDERNENLRRQSDHRQLVYHSNRTGMHTLNQAAQQHRGENRDGSGKKKMQETSANRQSGHSMQTPNQALQKQGGEGRENVQLQPDSGNRRSDKNSKRQDGRNAHFQHQFNDPDQNKPQQGSGGKDGGCIPYQQHSSDSDDNKPKQGSGGRDSGHQIMLKPYQLEQQQGRDGYDHGQRGWTYSPEEQKQIQLWKPRQVEASKQMLYGVFGNVISILEVLESRVDKKGKIYKSKIAIPNQSSKSESDIRSIVQGQLLAFQMQNMVCPSNVSSSVNKELRVKTILWAAVRQDHKLAINEIDTYICKLYKILVKGRIQHEINYQSRNQVSAETMKETIPHIFKGRHDALAITEAFDEDHCKKAESPKTRYSRSSDAMKIGAERMSKTCPELKTILDNDVIEFTSSDVDM
ncbi:uncharacterized protein LOC127842578 isoform X2 [Dreissena polymorpha]|uniref:uncharacterized protein LOC127842578 isoform X2 n=1 Tax=Dreissena polymorpha TaxID=45954 RepID=UPI002263EBE8|nr:uncharacterized protein LOC127842578 isoform X2 [Dreissena polymorpha]